MELNVQDAMPGSFSTVLTGTAKNGNRFARLSMYSFRADKTFQQHYWFFVSSDRNHWGDGGSEIGNVNGVQNRDSRVKVQSHLKFTGQEPLQNLGTWSLDNTVVEIKFNEGDARITNCQTEKWKLSLIDLKGAAKLWRIDLIFANYVEVNGNFPAKGWGFGGGPGCGFTFRTSAESMDVDHRGDNYLWNASLKRITEGTSGLLMAPAALGDSSAKFQITSTGIRRCFDRTSNVFCYHRFVTGHGMSSRRTSYQHGHDFAEEGHIANRQGHILSGLQIIDSSEAYRGQVFVEFSRNNHDDGDNDVGIHFYLKNQQ